MNKTQLQTIEESNQTGEFSEEQWFSLINKLAVIFNISQEKKNMMIQNKVMKLTAAIPFIAGCKNPMRIAIAHLSTYHIASITGGKDVFEHRFSDNENLYSRLERISHFDGGSEIILKRGMKMLVLAMLEDHKTDLFEDEINNKYNPLSNNTWNYSSIVYQLKSEVNSIPCEALDSIIDINVDVPGFWDS